MERASGAGILDRVRQLDGLRGIAAVSVAFSHFYFLFPASKWTLFWKISPLYVLIAGHEAVVLFFVLSGFALHKMWTARGGGYGSFAARRTLRIYGPYLAALVLAVAGTIWLSRGPRPGFSEWFNNTWTRPVRWHEVWPHVAFIGEYDTTRFNNAFWSVVQEMRISFAFPLLCLVFQGRSIFWALLLMAMPVQTLHFAGLFVVGIYIAARNPKIKWLGVSFVLYYCGRLVAHVLPASYVNLIDIPIGAGAAGIVLLALQSPRFSHVLQSKPVLWLGDRSYSLYLVQVTVLMSLINLLDIKTPSAALLLLYIPVTLIATQMFYLAVERPLLALSRKLR